MTIALECPKCFSSLEVAVYMGHCLNRQCGYVFGLDSITPQKGPSPDTRSLRLEKKYFIHASMAGRTVKKEFGLDNSDLEKIGAMKRFGMVRYMKEDVVRYVRYKDK